MNWLKVTLWLLFMLDIAASTWSTESPITKASLINGNKNDSNNGISHQFSANDSDAMPSSSLNLMSKKPINNDTRQTVSLSSPDNDYTAMKRAFDTLNGKIDTFMNLHTNEMSFLSSKLNYVKDKLNALEVLQHEIDQLMNRQTAAQQKLQMIQDAIFGSQSLNTKLDRVEMNVQQLNVQMEELMQTERKFTVPGVQTRQKKPTDDSRSKNDEEFTDCESKIEQLVGFVHSFAELNRLESTDILNRLGNMQSQLIQFFDAKGSILLNQRTTNDTTSDFEAFEETTEYSTTPNDANEMTDTTSLTDSPTTIIPSTETPPTVLSFNDNTQLSSSNRKRKRMTNMRKRSRRNHRMSTSYTMNSTFHSENSYQIEGSKRHNKRHDSQHETISTLDNPKMDVEIDYGAIKSNKQVSAKYGQPSTNGCHQFTHTERSDEIHNFTTASGYAERLCSFDGNGSAWTVIQSRGMLNNMSTPENFNRSWNDYKIGFGHLNGEFWYGNDQIHKLTYDDDMELKIHLEAWDGRIIDFEYEVFRVDSEQNHYNLFVSGFKGINKNLDALQYHHNQDFSTFDRQNDKSGINDDRACCSCAKSYASGWWFNNCIESNLNGIYQFYPFDNNFVGIVWEKWLGDYSLKATKMMIRPKVTWSTEDDTRDRDDANQKSPDDP